MASGRSTNCSITTQVKAVIKAINTVIAVGKSAPVYTTPTLTMSLTSIVQQPNSRAFQDFCDELYSTLLTCFSSIGKVRNQLAHERALAKFHCSRTGSLPAIWQHLFTKLNIVSISTFLQQAVNFRLFNDMVVDRFGARTKCEVQPTHVLSWDEQNAIKYAGGYVVNKLAKQYRKMGTEKAGQFAECLQSMINIQEASNMPNESQWISNIDRGGLFHISDNAFAFLKAMELCIQKKFAYYLTPSSDTTDTKESILRDITDKDEVQLHWHTLTIDISDAKDVDELLNRVADSWVMIRGFAITSSWLEQYKITSHKVLLKGKA